MAKVNTDVWDEDKEEYVPATVYVKPCPFCGHKPTSFGRDIIRGKVCFTVIHLEIDGKYCPLNQLVFPIDAWNTRVCCDG